MSNIVSFKGANLPTVQELSQSLRSMETEVELVTFIKMDKTGTWVYGADQTEVEEGSKWAVNPFSFTHGFIAWGEGEVLSEALAPLSQPLPEVGPAPAAAEKGWEKQVGMSMACISGDDKGLNVRFGSTSFGGRKAVQALAVKIADHIEKNPDKPVPIVTLDVDHYQHRMYGKILTPLFTIVDWASMDGEQEEAPKEEAKPEARRRRRSV